MVKGKLAGFCEMRVWLCRTSKHKVDTLNIKELQSKEYIGLRFQVLALSCLFKHILQSTQHDLSSFLLETFPLQKFFVASFISYFTRSFHFLDLHFWRFDSARFGFVNKEHSTTQHSTTWRMATWIRFDVRYLNIPWRWTTDYKMLRLFSSATVIFIFYVCVSVFFFSLQMEESTVHSGMEIFSNWMIYLQFINSFVQIFSMEYRYRTRNNTSNWCAHTPTIKRLISSSAFQNYQCINQFSICTHTHTLTYIYYRVFHLALKTLTALHLKTTGRNCHLNSWKLKF